MSTWWIVVAGHGACYLVHVLADTETLARRQARERISRDAVERRLRVKSAERVYL